MTRRKLVVGNWKMHGVSADLAAGLSGSESWGMGSIFGIQRLPANRVYWYAALPAHKVAFGRMARAIADQAASAVPAT